MMLLNNILRKNTDGYELHKSQEKINHLEDMEDIKLFVENAKELASQIKAVKI